jgi:alpha-L-arabinofuranosidase
MNTDRFGGRTRRRRGQKLRGFAVALAVAGTGVGLTLTPVAMRGGVAHAASTPVYDDVLGSGWSDWSWRTTTNLEGTSPVHTGSRSITAQITSLGGSVSLRTATPVPADVDTIVSFSVYGGTNGINLLVYTSSDDWFSSVSNFVPVTAPANGWANVTITAAQLGRPAAIGRLSFSGGDSSITALFALDDITIGQASQPPVTQPPTTLPPVTQPPTTLPPVTQPPTTLPPVTQPPTTLPPTTQPPTPIDGTIVIDPTENWPFEQRLRGSNVSYFAPASVLQNQTLRARTSGVSTLLRFPGGQDSQIVGWASCQLQTDIANAAPCRVPQTRSRTSDFFGLVRATGAEAMLTVSVNVTAKENAAYVAFANGRIDDARVIGIDQHGADWKTVGYWAQHRANAGFPEPMAVNLWEFGNETYGGLAGGSRCVSYGWEVVYSCNPEEFLNGLGTGAARFDGYVATREAMKAIDPSIRVGAPAVDPNEGYNDWTRNLLRVGGAYIDFLEVHHYNYWIPPTNDDAGNAQILAASKSQVYALRARMNAVADEQGSRRIPILLSEFNLTPEPRNDPAQRVSTVLNAMVQTEMVGTMASLDGFMGANYLELVGEAQWRDTFYSMIHNDGRFTRGPEYWGAVMWSEFGEQMVANASTVDNATLTVFSGRRSDGSVTLLVLNKSAAAKRAEVSVRGVTAMRSVMTDTAQGASLAARTMNFNGVADPSDDRSNAPGVTVDLGGAPTFVQSFPPASITLLTIR